jgi:hypothetical protein
MRDRLEQQLAALKRRKLISVWHDRDIITAEAEWRKETERELNDADLILLLISASFLDSDLNLSALSTVRPEVERRFDTIPGEQGRCETTIAWRDRDCCFSARGLHDQAAAEGETGIRRLGF